MANGSKIGAVMMCMDCRLHHPAAQQHAQICEILGVDDIYIDTEAGPDGAVLHDTDRCCAALKNLIIIKEAKLPDAYAIVAHYDCAGHAVSNEQHDQDVVAAAEKLSLEIFAEAGRIVPLIAYPNEGASGPTWLIKKVVIETVAAAA